MWVRVRPLSSCPCWSRRMPRSWSRSSRPSDLAKSSSALASPAIFTALTVTAKIAALPFRFVGRIIGREGDVDVALVARLGADQLLLEARDQLAGAELDRHVLARCRLRTARRPTRAGEIDDDLVAVRGGLALRARPSSSCSTATSRCELLVDRCFVGFDRQPLELQPVDLGRRDFGQRLEPDADFGVLAGLIFLVELDLRLHRRAQLLLAAAAAGRRPGPRR